MHKINPRRKSRLTCHTGLLATFTAAAVALGCAFALGGAADSPHAARGANAVAGSAVRIGIYDSRAIAVAYVRSDQSARNLQALLVQRAEAEKAGDKKRVKELNARGDSLQIRHLWQGFSMAPVDDILDTVRDSLPGVAQQANVAAIASVADYHDASVELVDVTDDLVRLFNPDARTLKVVTELRKHKPMAIEDAARMPAKQ